MQSGFTMLRSLFVLVAAGLVGCSAQKAPPSPSDPASAKEALRKVLDAWKTGDALAAFTQANPDIQVVNRPWQQGGKLLDFTIDDTSEMNGYDVQFTVRETQDAGKKAAARVTYAVSTSPKLVVIRTEPGG